MLPVVTAASLLGGVQVDTKNGSTKIFIHIIGITSDLPAKAMLRNAHGHTGTSACTLCDIEGFSVPSGDGHCIAYIKKSGEVISRRTHQSVLDCSLAAEHEGLPVSFSNVF